jgi:YD repeat-containing protein
VEPTWCQVNADPECEYLYMREVLSSQTFTYDDVGNRTDGGATLLAGGNRYATFNGFQLTYDAEGNLTRKYKPGVIDQTLVWDRLGRLASVTTNGSTVSLCNRALRAEMTLERLHSELLHVSTADPYVSLVKEDLYDAVEHTPFTWRRKLDCSEWESSDMYAALEMHRDLISSSASLEEALSAVRHFRER